MRVVTFVPGGSGESPLPFLGRLIGNRWSSPIFALFVLTSASAVAEILPTDCARAAKYSESKRGVAMLVLQNGQTIFEHYANGGAARERWAIFSGTKSFWGVAALAATRDGLFELDDPVSDTITEWKSDPRKSQITIGQLLSQTDGIEGASRLQRASVRDRNAMAIRLPVVAAPGSAFIYGPSHLQIFSELLRRKLRGRSTIGYFEGRVSNRLGLGRLNYKKDTRGNPLPATGFELTAREWACLGELVLGQGSYHGRQIVPAALLREAFAGSAANPSYGRKDLKHGFPTRTFCGWYWAAFSKSGYAGLTYSFVWQTVLDSPYEQIHDGVRSATRDSPFHCRYCGPRIGRQL